MARTPKSAYRQAVEAGRPHEAVAEAKAAGETMAEVLNERAAMREEGAVLPPSPIAVNEVMASLVRREESFSLTPSGPEAPPDSGQNYATPWEFVRAVEGLFGPMKMDLAASEENAKAPAFFTAEDDALAQDWAKLSGNLWLNPPYADLGVWAEKCKLARTLGSLRKIFMLCPASVSTEWWAEHVHGEALVLFVRPRLKFVGAVDPYPKDLALCVFGKAPGYEPWRWDEQR